MINEKFIDAPNIFNEYKNVDCFISTKHYSNLSITDGENRNAVLNNRKRFFFSCKISINQVSYQRQTHSDISNFVEKPSFFCDSDALYTNIPGNYLAISIADCVPVFLYEKNKNVIAAIHSGWKGTHKKIAIKVIEKISKRFNINKNNFLAYIGPSISVENYEVGRDLYDLFPERSKKIINGKYYLDLKKENYYLLLESGIKPKNIEISEYCTYDNRDLFYSYRREGKKSGRMIGVIGIK